MAIYFPLFPLHSDNSKKSSVGNWPKKCENGNNRCTIARVAVTADIAYKVTRRAGIAETAEIAV